jgi:two-component system cell cycle response regulator
MAEAEILIIEDSPTQAEQLRYILEKHCYRVSIAGNGKNALAAIAVRKPDLIISDIVMPEMDGYEICRRIKKNEDLRDIPVLLLTVLSEPRDVIMGLECGADYFVTKPYVEEHLLSCIRHMQINQIQLTCKNSTGGLELHFDGQDYVINADRQQILNLLLSTYETAIHKNRELIQARKELQQSEERYRRLVENAPDAILVYSEGLYLYANNEALRLFGADRTDQLVGKPVTSTVHPDCLEKVENWIRQVEKGGFANPRQEQKLLRLDRTAIEVDVVATQVDFKGKPAVQVILRNISAMKRMQEALEKSNELFKELSITDHLTQLYNRRFLMDTLEREFERIRRKGGSLSLVIIDIDHFKLINDTYGHLFGDTVLTAIAKVVKAGVRCYDVAARYGGDEFILALPETSLTEALVVAEHLRKTVQAMSFSPQMETFAVSISLGAAVFPSPLIDSIDLLLRQADEALYLAKQKGRNRVEAIMPQG